MRVAWTIIERQHRPWFATIRKKMVVVWARALFCRPSSLASSLGGIEQVQTPGAVRLIMNTVLSSIRSPSPLSLK